jgi:hypothetical protein
MMHAIFLAGYLVLVGLMVAVEVYSMRRPNSIAPLGEMLEHVMSSRTVRVGIIAAWWWLGWHFLFAPTVQVAL